MAEHGNSASIVPAGAFHFPVERYGQTRKYAFLLLQDFTLLAFSSAVDPLRIANQLAQKPLYQWDILSESGAPVLSSSGVEISARRALTLLDADVNLFVCSGNNGRTAASAQTLAVLRKHSRMGGVTGGICTGAMTLARAGLLENRTFTLHWENQPAFAEGFPDLMPTQSIFEKDGNILTCGGGAGATEMMLQIIAQDNGDDFAIAVSDMCLRGSGLEHRPLQQSSIAAAIQTRNPRIVQIVREMYENIEDPTPLEQLAHSAGMSRRQMERYFRQKLGETPLAFYRNIRLDRARSLLGGTDMNVIEIATACGFGSSSAFAQYYRARFGASPAAYRKTTFSE